MVWVLFAVACVELAVAHLLLGWWWPRLAIGVSVATAGSLGWLAVAIRSLRTWPSAMDADGLVLRAGRFRGIVVDRAAIGGLRSDWDAAALRRKGVLNLALASYPNVVLGLTRPVRWRGRTIDTIAHRIDDPAGFAAALQRLGERDG